MANAEQRFDGQPGRQRVRVLQIAGAALFLIVCLAGLFVLRYTAKDSMANDLTDTVPITTAKSDKNPPLFVNWERPDIAIVLSGQMYGYLQPCGCSYPQYGGLARRYEFMQSLKEKNWPVIAADLGDLAQTTGAVFAQRQLKYEKAMMALEKMGYAAAGLGANEFSFPLFDALSHYSLNNLTPVVVAANLMRRNAGELFHNLNVKSWAIGQDKDDKGQPRGPKVGIVGLVGPSVAKEVRDPDAKFSNNNAADLEKSLLALKAENAEAYVLLYQGSLVEAKAAADFCQIRHRQHPQIPALDIVLCLSEASEPPGLPQFDKVVGRTMIVEIGHKGRYVGVVGVYGSGGQRRLKYQLVSVGPQFQPTKSNPITELMDEYAKEVHRNNYIADFPRMKHPIQSVGFPGARYVGSDTCGNCHEHAYKVWKESAHAHAFETLKTEKNPGLRNFDGECVKCHVVGFNYHTGYLDKQNNARTNSRLEHVGCESCHGPGSEHVNNPANNQLHALMNPYKTNIPGMQEQFVKHRLNLIDMSCQKCHDTDNDVNWTFEKWVEIIHMTPAPAKDAPPVVDEKKEPDN